MKNNKIYNLCKKLWPINRSLTGEGNLETLKILKQIHNKLKIKNINSGKKVFDWKIPNELNAYEAWIKNSQGKKILDFKKNNLHLVSYSKKIHKKISLEQLKKNLHFIKDQPEAIPYVTSYYKKNWGFCMSFNEIKKLKKGNYEVFINSSIKKTNLIYGEILIKGKYKKEIFLSTYICHPSMANNELSGPLVSMGLINYFQNKKLNKTLRFIFIPETIGSISYLNKNIKYLKENVIGGYNLSCIGDERQHSCMFSKYQNSPSDEAVIEAYKLLKIKNYKVYPFLKRGSDERQYNYPGIDLKISSIFRTKYYEYPEYHTSLDNFNLVTLKGCVGGFNVARKSIEILLERIYPKCKIMCEPQMGKRDLYPTLSTKNENELTRSYMDFLQYADGTNSLEKISNLVKLELNSVKKINSVLFKNNLVN